MSGRVLLARSALLALVSFMAIACGGGEQPPGSTELPGSTEQPPGSYAIPTPIFTPTATPEPQYLTEVIPPCAPVEGVADDPCDQPGLPISSTAASMYLGEEPFDYAYYLNNHFSLSDWTPHLAVRATTIPSTFRCDLGQPYRFQAYLNFEPTYYRVGHTDIYCYIDVRVNEYMIGSGPSELTLIVDWGYIFDRHSVEDIERIRSSMERRYLEGGTLQRRGEQIHLPRLAATEWVFFIGPSINAAQEVWAIYHQWQVKRLPSGNVAVLHPHVVEWYNSDRALYDQYETSRMIPSPETFRTNLRAAYQTLMEETGGRILPATETKYLGTAQWPMRITDANRLQQFGIDVGNYDHPDGPPERPSAPCGMGAVDNQVDNYGLMQDCSTLLALKDRIRGTASLNWAVDEDIDDWDGVTLSSGRVVTLDLENESLTGTLSNRLGDLSALTTLKLADNSLTGHIPASLADLDLDELRLAGNDFAGCIPAGLRDIDDHDLGSLGLGDCLTPPPDAGSSLSFTSSAYQFSVAQGAAVGAVQASDTNPTRTLAYTIIMGNAAGKFASGGASGSISVAAELDYETRQQYTLTVNVNNSAGDNKTTTVTVNVTDVAEDPPTPQHPT